ncbi:hypothetical protein HQ585_00545 [candidate division KSB1 bacterium]|nr:hypothetical protein [candidate division KSB1 bacterium]
MRLKLLIILFCFLSISNKLQGQTETIKFDHFSDQERAPQSYINVILQDQTGFMWFGTATGLVRYNAYDFTYFTHEPDNMNSLHSNNILSLYADKNKKKLWIGLQNGVLNQLDLHQEIFSSHQIPQIEDSPASVSNINAILESRNGNLWIGTDESGLYQFQIDNKQFMRYESGTTTIIPIQVTGINSLFEDSEGILWIASFTGLYRYDPEREAFDQYLIDPGYPLPRGVCQAMIMLPKGVDWKGLRLKAELEVKGKTYPVQWSCDEKIQADGSITLQPGV